MKSPGVRLVALSYNEKALDKVLDVAIGERAITLGRDQSSDLWLEDEERIISRRQARLEPKPGGVYRLVNASSTSPIFVNGAMVPPGQAREIALHDSILVGRYALELRAGAAAAGQARDARTAPAAVPAASASAAPPTAASVPAMAAAPPAPARLPDDFDVFAPPVAHDHGADVAAGDAMLDGFASSHTSLLADLPGSSVAPLEADAAPAGGLVPPGVGQDEILDPLQLIEPAASDLLPASAADAVGEIDSLFALPRSAGADEGLSPEVVQPGSSPPAEDSVSTAGAGTAVLQEGASALHIGDDLSLGIAVPGIETAAPAVVPLMDFPVEEFSAPLQAPPGDGTAAAAPPESVAPVTPPLARAAPAAPADAPAGPDPDPLATASLREAFAAACGIDIDAVPEFTPEFTRRLGELMAELLVGTLRLMHGRSVTKHELRANVTVITAQGNNPLKFAPDHTTALMQLLQPRFSGFMQPVEAVRNAFDDLAAHQVGLLMGSRAAMYQIVGKLAPKKIEAAAGKPPVGSAILPALREARLWSDYVEHYESLTGKAREQFEAMFQAEFTRAYEGEIDRMWKVRKG